MHAIIGPKASLASSTAVQCIKTDALSELAVDTKLEYGGLVQAALHAGTEISVYRSVVLGSTRQTGCGTQQRSAAVSATDAGNKAKNWREAGEYTCCCLQPGTQNYFLETFYRRKPVLFIKQSFAPEPVGSYFSTCCNDDRWIVKIGANFKFKIGALVTPDSVVTTSPENKCEVFGN